MQKIIAGSVKKWLGGQWDSFFTLGQGELLGLKKGLGLYLEFLGHRDALQTMLDQLSL